MRDIRRHKIISRSYLLFVASILLICCFCLTGCDKGEGTDPEAPIPAEWLQADDLAFDVVTAGNASYEISWTTASGLTYELLDQDDAPIAIETTETRATAVVADHNTVVQFNVTKDGVVYPYRLLISRRHTTIGQDAITGKIVSGGSGGKTKIQIAWTEKKGDAQNEYQYIWGNARAIVRGPEITLDSPGAKETSFRVRRKTEIKIAENDDNRAKEITIEYSAWSKKIGVKALTDISDFYYSDADEKIYVRDTGANGYDLLAYYDDPESPFRKETGRIEQVSGDSEWVTIDFDVSTVSKSFTLRISPSNVNVVKDNVLLVGNAGAEKTIQYTDPISQLSIEKDSFVWEEKKGYDYIIVKMHDGTPERDDNKNNLTIKNGRVYYNNFILNESIEFKVKPVHTKGNNTFTHWIKKEVAVLAPPNITPSKNADDAIEIRWTARATNTATYWVDVVRSDGTVVQHRNEKTSLFSVAQMPEAPGKYQVQVTCMDVNCIGKTAAIEIEQLPAPQIRYCHHAATDTERDYIKIRIDNRNEDYAYGYTLENVGQTEFDIAWEGEDLVIRNSPAAPTERECTIWVYTKAKDGVKTQLNSAKKAVGFSKNKPIRSTSISVDAQGIYWGEETGGTFRCALTHRKTDVSSEQSWEKDIAATSISFDALSGTLSGGTYTFTLRQLSTSDTELDGEETQYTFAKAYAPVEASCQKLTLAWKYLGVNDVATTGYKILVDDVSLLNVTSQNNSLGLLPYASSFSAEKENVIKIIAMGGRTTPTLDSEPLIFTGIRKEKTPQDVRIQQETLSFSGETNKYHVMITLPDKTEFTEEVSQKAVALTSLLGQMTSVGKYSFRVKAYGDGNTTFDSEDSAAVGITKLSRPVLAVRNQKITIAFEQNVAATPIDLKIKINAGNWISLGNVSEYDPEEQGALLAGTYEMTLVAIGDGSTTLTSEHSAALEVIKQAAPRLTFTRQGSEQSVRLQFDATNSGGYRIRLDSGAESDKLISVDTYVIDSGALLNGAHTLRVWMRENDERNMLASAESTCTFTKLTAPTVDMNADYAAYWESPVTVRTCLFDVSVTLNGTNTRHTGKQWLRYNDFAGLPDGTTGTIRVKALGSVEDKTVDSDDSADYSFRRAASPEMHFSAQKITWEYELGEKYQINVNGQARETVESQGEYALEFAEPLTTYGMSVRTLGDYERDLLPASATSNVINVRRIATPQLTFSTAENAKVDWASVSNASGYTCTLDDADVTETLTNGAGRWALDVSTITTAGTHPVTVRALAQAYTPGDDYAYLSSRESALDTVKLPAPNVTIEGQTLRIVRSEGTTYFYRVGAGVWVSAVSDVDLSEWEAGEYTIGVKARKDGCIDSEITVIGYEVEDSGE